MPLTPVVLDASVLIPATVNTSIHYRVLEYAISSNGLYLSDHILNETRRNVQSDFGATPKEADEYLALLRDNATMVTPTAVPDDACAHANDLPVLGTAVAANAAYLVSADPHLTDLVSFHAIQIVKPGTYYRLATGS